MDRADYKRRLAVRDAERARVKRMVGFSDFPGAGRSHRARRHQQPDIHIHAPERAWMQTEGAGLMAPEVTRRPLDPDGRTIHIRAHASVLRLTILEADLLRVKLNNRLADIERQAADEAAERRAVIEGTDEP